MNKPCFKDCSGDFDAYLIKIKEFINLNPKDLSAKIDLLRFLARTRNFVEFEEFSKNLVEVDNCIVQREIARYHLFAKKDVDKAIPFLKKAISLNINEPMWVYYFAKQTFNYYERLCDNLLYTAIPKNASTSLKNFVLDKVYNEPDKNPHSQFGNPFFKSHHFPQKEIEVAKKVLVVREPIARIKSYYNKNIIEEDSLNFELGLIGSGNKEFYGLPTQPSFEFFIENIWGYCLVFNDVLHHVLPQSAYIRNIKDYDIVVDIKSLDSMVSDVSHFLGIDYSGPAPRKMIPRIKKSLELDLVNDFLQKIYLDDYILLHEFYPFENDKAIRTELISFNPQVYDNIAQGANKKDSDIDELKKALFGFFQGELSSIDILSKLGSSELDTLVNKFDVTVERNIVEVNFDDKKSHSELGCFEQAVINKIKSGITNIQDQMIIDSNLSLNINGKLVFSDKSLILTPHLIAVPFLFENNLYFIYFAGFHSQIIAVFNFAKSTYTSFNYLVKQKPPVDRELPSKNSIKFLIKNIFDFPYEIFSYLAFPSVGRGCLLGALHMGHSLWNDLTGIQRLETKGLIGRVNSFVVLKGADPYGILEEGFAIRKDLGLVRYSYLQWKEQIANCYYNNFFWIRATDNFVTDALAQKIISESPKGYRELSQDEITITIGLRMENRTWVNQLEGWYEVIKHIAGKFIKTTVVIDGHNVSKHGGAIKSAGETTQHAIIDKENELVDYLRNQEYDADVNFVSCIETSLIDNLKEINKSNFFIAPWGAGLSKYRWVCNLPGIVLTSNWNLKSRPDLRIYDSPQFRENAIESIFLDQKFIQDIGNDHSLVKSDLDQKHNFKVDIKGLLNTIDELVEKLRGKNEL